MSEDNVVAIAFDGGVDEGPPPIRYRWIRHTTEEVADWKKLRDPSYWRSKHSQLALRESGNSGGTNTNALVSSTEGVKVNDAVSDSNALEQDKSDAFGEQLVRGEGEKTISFEIPAPPEGSSNGVYRLMIRPTPNGLPFIATWEKNQELGAAATMTLVEDNDTSKDKNKAVEIRESFATIGTGSEIDIDIPEDEVEDQTDNHNDVKKRKISELFFGVLRPPPPQPIQLQTEIEKLQPYHQRGLSPSASEKFDERVNQLEEKMGKLRQGLEKALSRKQRTLVEN